MTAPAYQQEPWFGLLRAAVQRSTQRKVAQQLAVAESLVNQVLRGTGEYGKGTASTRRFAQRVNDAFGKWECPYLSDAEAPREISAEQCRSFAHREAPTGSPRDLAHWRACRACPQKEHSAPPVAKVQLVRKPIQRPRPLTPAKEAL